MRWLLPLIVALMLLAGCGETTDSPDDSRNTTPTGATGTTGGNCEPGYEPCVPRYPPDVDCPDVGENVSVTGSDPHGLDRDGDGVGCET